MAIARHPVGELVGAVHATAGNYDTSYAAGATAIGGMCVLILQIGSAADSVTTVTYGIAGGAVPLTERRFIPITSEAGAVYLYWGSGVVFPTGTQTLRVAKTAVSQKVAICPMTVAAGMQAAVDVDTQSVSTVSVTNPSWAHTTQAAPTECFSAIVSDLNAITGMAAAANWSLLAALVDEGNQQRVFARRTMASAGDALPGMTAPAEGYAGGSISFKEAPLIVPPSEPPTFHQRSPRPVEQSAVAGPYAPVMPSQIIQGG